MFCAHLFKANLGAPVHDDDVDVVDDAAGAELRLVVVGWRRGTSCSGLTSVRGQLQVCRKVQIILTLRHLANRQLTNDIWLMDDIGEI